MEPLLQWKINAIFVTLRQVGGTTVAVENQCNIRNTEASWWNHCCRGKSIRITYSKYVCVALGIQHAMRRIICVDCLALQYLSTLSH